MHFGSLFLKMDRPSQKKDYFSYIGCPKNENPNILVQKIRYVDMIKILGHLKIFAFLLLCIFGFVDFAMKLCTASLSNVGLFLCIIFCVSWFNCLNISGLLHCWITDRGKQFPLPSVISSSLSGRSRALTFFKISKAILLSSCVAMLPYSLTINFMLVV